MIVLDTNVLSELMKPVPEAGVSEYVAAQPSSSFFTTTVTQAEILYGVALLPMSKRKSGLEEAIVAMFEVDFAGRVLPFDSDAARAYAEIAAGRRQAGMPISQFDAQIAAICRSRGAALASRNASHFAQCGIQVINPWEGIRQSS
ncbi:MAG: type II toxin-antitoxin system VapC family toxin [Deltaproteobacteria bacterium]|nr:type II toxin-antitoxin system VapC family toxin [Deltaproteobacteria bacterium]